MDRAMLEVSVKDRIWNKVIGQKTKVSDISE